MSGSQSTKRAPGAAGLEHEVAAHPAGQFTGDRQAEPEAAVLAPARRGRSARRCARVPPRGPLGPVAHPIARAPRSVDDRDAHAGGRRRVAQRVVEQDAQITGDVCRDRRCAQCLAAVVDADWQSCDRPAGPRARPAPSAALRRARPARGAAGTPASIRLRSSSSPASCERRTACSSARVGLLARVLDVERLVLEVGDQQVEHELQRRDRCAQLVRCGGHERAPRLFLLAQSCLHVARRCG